MWTRVVVLTGLGLLLGSFYIYFSRPVIDPSHKSKNSTNKTYKIGENYGHLPAGRFSNGLVPVQSTNNGKWGYRNLAGKWVIEPNFNYARPFFQNRAFVKRNDGWTYIDREGDPITSERYLWSYRSGDFAQDRAAVRTESGWGYVNRNGKWVISPQFDWAGPFQEGLAWVRKNNRKGFIDKTGDWNLPPIYEDAQSFSNGLAPVEHEGKWGYVNENGDWVLNNRFDWATPFTGKRARVRLNNKPHIINRGGELIDTAVGPLSPEQNLSRSRGNTRVPPKNSPSSEGRTHNLSFDNSKSSSLTVNPNNSSGQVRLIEQSKKWKFIDKQGKTLFSFSDSATQDKNPGTFSTVLHRDPGGERYISEREDCEVTRCWELAPHGDIRPLHTIEVTRYPYKQPSRAQLRAAMELRVKSFRAARRQDWFNYEEAKEDGYRSVSRLDNLGAHHVNDTFLADREILNPHKPENLMFYPTPDGRKLVGVMYVMNSNFAEGPQVGGPLTTWHYHNLETVYCRKYGQLPIGPAINGSCETGTPSKRSPEMLHVWFVDHPDGPFATSMVLSDAFQKKLNDLSVRDREEEVLREEILEEVRR